MATEKRKSGVHVSSIMKKRCSAKNRNGDRCKTFALRSEDKCVWHSDSKRARESKNKPFKVKSKKEFQLILQREVNRVLKGKKGALKRASEVRQLVSTIFQIEGGKPPTVDGGNQEDTFEDKVARAKKRVKKK